MHSQGSPDTSFASAGSTSHSVPFAHAKPSFSGVEILEQVLSIHQHYWPSLVESAQYRGFSLSEYEEMRRKQEEDTLLATAALASLSVVRLFLLLLLSFCASGFLKEDPFILTVRRSCILSLLSLHPNPRASCRRKSFTTARRVQISTSGTKRKRRLSVVALDQSWMVPPRSLRS